MQQKQQKKKKADSSSAASTKQANTPKKKTAAKLGAAASSSKKKKRALALPASKKKERKQLAAPAKSKPRKQLAAPAKGKTPKQLSAPATEQTKKKTKAAAPTKIAKGAKAAKSTKTAKSTKAPTAAKAAQATKAAKTTKTAKAAKTAKTTAKKQNVAQAKPAAKRSELAQKIKASDAKAAGATSTEKAAAAPSPAPTKQQDTGTQAPVTVATGIANFKNKILGAKDWVVQNARTPKVIIIAVLLVVYLIGGLVFSSHFLPGTTLNGDDVSWKSVASTLTKAQGTDGNGYALQVVGDGVDLKLAAADIDFAFDEEAYKKDVSSHTAGFLWPLGLLMPRDFETYEGVSFDEGKVTSALGTAIDKVNETAKQPKNATITYDSAKGSFVAVSEEEGTAVDTNAAAEKVTNAIKALHDRAELGEDELLHPATFANDPAMDAAVNKANSFAANDISLTVNGKEAAVASSDLIRSWLTVDDSYNIVGNLDAVTYWTRGELSEKIDTMATARTYTRTNDGKRIEVYGGGTYGWSSDGAKLAEMICDSIAKNSSEAIEIPMKSKGEVYVRGKQDWGPRYVDVDLTEQYVRMFDKDSKIIMESECVSGNLAENNDTVTGVFALEDKQSPMTLIGNDENGDGEPDYENEVQYWMPFFGGYGLHDALWRDYFGEDVYQYDGSHGCINLPYYAAEQLYNEIKVGDVVVVHF